MDTPQLVQECAWRFYASRYLNSARFGAQGTPFSAAMTIKGFFICDAPKARSADQVQQLLRSTIAQAYPEFAWRFGNVDYQPHRFAYDAEGILHPFDYASEVRADPASPGVESFWNFVEQQSHQDETDPQVFGEALRCRFTVAPDGAIFGRFTFNHALVDGLMIFKFMVAWERILEASGARLRELDLGKSGISRRWRTARTDYAVEHVRGEDSPTLARHGYGYMPILYEITKRRWLTRIRHAVALPRNPLMQLVIAPVRKALTYKRFRQINEAQIRQARRGTRLSGLLEEYRNDPAGGDEYIRRMMSFPVIGRHLSGYIAGDMMVSSFMFKHSRYLAFPVVHPLQREGVSICSVSRHKGETIVRITRARQLRGPRPGVKSEPARRLGESR